VKVCILSDTHGFLDSRIPAQLKDCTEIWHAGDFGGLGVADRLKQMLPLRGVFGNIDDSAVQRQYPEVLRFECEGVRVMMVHIGGKPGTAPPVRKLLLAEPCDLFICGHSHILRAMPDPKFKHFHLNPGACGNQGFHQIRTLVRLNFEGGKMRGLEVIELGARGTPAKNLMTPDDERGEVVLLGRPP
jgi:putative phosphoesterase